MARDSRIVRQQASKSRLIHQFVAWVLGVAAVAGSVFLAAVPANADLSTLYASASGTSADACTGSDPCDLATALNDVAPHGRILLASAGNEGDNTTWYKGNFTISASLTVAAEPGVTDPIVDGLQSGTVFTVASPSVTLTVTGITVQDGDASIAHAGGGIDNSQGGVVTVTDDTFIDNAAYTSNQHYGTGGGGGAIDSGGNGVLTVVRSTFTDNVFNTSDNPNHASQNGGGAINSGGNATATIADSTFSGNTSNTGGAAINNGNQYGTGTMSVIASTFASGQVISNGNNRGSSRLAVAGNVFLGNCGQGNGGSSTPYWEDDGYNVGVNSSCLGSAYSSTSVPAAGSGVNGPGDLIDAGLASELGPLADNGGPTKTMTLLTGSQAIAAIPTNTTVTVNSQPITLCATSDERSFASTPGTACDVGAVQTGGVAPVAPVVTSVSPAGGPLNGGGAVTITGTGFTGVDAVYFGYNAATSATVDSDTEITATVPPGNVGTVDVLVTSPDEDSATGASDQYTYASTPTVTNMAPSTGPPSGGTAVTVTGTGFIGATSVLFGTATASQIVVISATALTVAAPAGTAGPVDITVTTPGGTSAVSSADTFTYVTPPTITTPPPITTSPTPTTTTTTAPTPVPTPAPGLPSPVGSSFAAAPGGGYWTVQPDGSVSAGGGAHPYGSMAGTPLNQPVVGITSTADGKGYWLVAADGGVFSFGDAIFAGSMAGTPLNQPVVGITATADGKGYWLVAADGGVFSFGDAIFAGSLAGTLLNRPVVQMASGADGKGYWLVAADGGVFSFGDANFAGSTAGLALAKPVVGLSLDPEGRGYWLVAADGGVFSFGGAPFYGSGAGTPSTSPTAGLVPNSQDTGYTLVRTDGGATTFGP